MIITCNNCNKKFDIDTNLIPDKGRLLQCASCDHKWFFKKEVLDNTVSPVDEETGIDSINIFDQNNSSINEEESVSNVPKDELEVDLEEETKEKIEVNINERTQVNTKPKKQKNFKILNIFVVAIISSSCLHTSSVSGASGVFDVTEDDGLLPSLASVIIVLLLCQFLFGL